MPVDIPEGCAPIHMNLVVTYLIFEFSLSLV